MSLAALETFKEWVQVKGTADDTLIERLLSAVSVAIAAELNRNIESASYTETLDGANTLRITLNNYPITAVASLSIDGQVIPASSSPVVPGYTFNGRLITLRGYTFTRGMDNVTISYTAGYASNAIPKDLEQACIEWAALRYKERDRIGHQSKAIAGETVTYFIGDMPKSVRKVLDEYKNVVPA